MKGKRLGGLIGIIIGVCLLMLSIYIKNRVGSARENLERGTGLFSKNPISEAFEGAAEGKIAQYEAIAKVSFYVGIILVIVGGGFIFFYRKK